MPYFTVSVRFLQPFCHGRGEGSDPEWPPSPLRMFQALLAAAAARWNERMQVAYSIPALRWLEERSPPTVIATQAVEATVSYRLYVPDNVGDKVAKSWKRGHQASIADYRTEKDVRPMHLKNEAVHYLYPISSHDSEFSRHHETLIAAARSITHLGWGIDMVAGNATVINDEEAANLPGERWLPTDDPMAQGYRVPTNGTLDALISRHHAFLNRLTTEGFKPVPPLSSFRIVGYRRSTEPSSRPFAAFAFYQTDSDRRRFFQVTRSIAVAGMLRSLTGKIARQTGHRETGADLDTWVNNYVMGHGEGDGLRPRFSYLPLVTIRPPHVLGDINRVLIAEPVGSSGAHCQWAYRTLRGQPLINEQEEEVALLMPLGREDKVLSWYVAKATTWATVTPVVLPGSDDGKFAKTEKLFLKALSHAGYSADALAELDFRNVSFWPGGELALRFHRPDYLKKGRWSVYHMRIRWKHPIKGPLALGAGRHCGLGVFAACD